MSQCKYYTQLIPVLSYMLQEFFHLIVFVYFFLFILNSFNKIHLKNHLFGIFSIHLFEQVHLLSRFPLGLFWGILLSNLLPLYPTSRVFKESHVTPRPPTLATRPLGLRLQCFSGELRDLL